MQTVVESLPAPINLAAQFRSRSRTLFALRAIMATSAASQFFATDWLGESDGFYCTWIAMSLFVFQAAGLRPIAAAGLGWFMGLASLGTTFWWAQDMLAYVLNEDGVAAKLVFIALIIWESAIFAVFGYLIANFRRRENWMLACAIPIAAWLVIEAFMPRVFPWTLGHSQLGALTLVQVADLGGGSLISMMVLVLSFLPLVLFDLWSDGRNAKAAGAPQALLGLTLLVLAWIGYGVHAKWTQELVVGSPLQVGVVQEDPSFSDALVKMRESSMSLPGVNLYVWPESTLGVHSLALESFADPDQVLDLSKPPMINPEPIVGLSAPVLVGGRSFSGDREQESAVYQTAFLIDEQGKIVNRYHKRALMPLGEYVPGEDQWPALHHWFQLGEYFARGDSAAPLRVGDDAEIGVVICYEDTVSNIVRSTVNEGAQAIVCIINDSAFESADALRQHMKLSRLRAVENRRYFIRSAGTGVSCMIDPLGRIQQSLPANQSGVFATQIYLCNDLTFFQLAGNWPPLFALGGLFVYGISGRFRRKRPILCLSGTEHGS